MNFAYNYKTTEKNFNFSLYEGEKIVMKVDDIKTEDSNNKISRDGKLFITNYRVLTINLTDIFDIPLEHIKLHNINNPFFGSSYICIYFSTSKVVPLYVKEQLKISVMTHSYPEYVMLKFKTQKDILNKANDIIKLSISNKDYLVSQIKEKEDKGSYNHLVQNTSQIINSSNVTGLGFQRTVNIINNQLKEQQNIISSSFSGISSLKTNAAQLIDIGKQLKSKLNKDESQSQEVNQILQKIGFIDPVTKEQTGKEYYKELSFQIKDFFETYFKQNEGF